MYVGVFGYGNVKHIEVAQDRWQIFVMTVMFLWLPLTVNFVTLICSDNALYHVRVCIQKFPDWPPGTRTANGTVLWH